MNEKKCENCGACNCAPVEIHGGAFAIKKFMRIQRLVTWHYHSEYRSLDIWGARTHEGNDIEGRRAGLYKAYPEKGHVVVGATLDELKRELRAYLGEGAE